MMRVPNVRMGLIVTLAVLAGVSAAVAVEEPEYQVVAEISGAEIRSYKPVVVAEVEVQAEFGEAGNKGFRPLVDYIGGANQESTKMSMTAPVTQLAARAGAGYRVQFTLPKEYGDTTVPKPRDPSVNIRRIESRLVAVRRYSGTWSEERFKEELAALREALKNSAYVETGVPEFSRYNPPFWPWFLRRNEVWIPVKNRAGS